MAIVKRDGTDHLMVKASDRDIRYLFRSRVELCECNMHGKDLCVVDGPITIAFGKLVIPTVKPRTVEDVKEEIIKVLGEWVDEPGEPASSHGRRMTVLIHELRALQAKAWK